MIDWLIDKSIDWLVDRLELNVVQAIFLKIFFYGDANLICEVLMTELSLRHFQRVMCSATQCRRVSLHVTYKVINEKRKNELESKVSYGLSACRIVCIDQFIFKKYPTGVHDINKFLSDTCTYLCFIELHNFYYCECCFNQNRTFNCYPKFV